MTVCIDLYLILSVAIYATYISGTIYICFLSYA